MAMSGMGMMAGMAAGQALVQHLMGTGDSCMNNRMESGIQNGPLQNLFRVRPSERTQVPQRPQQLVEPFMLVSKLAGRRRYRAADMSEELAELLQQKLAQLDFLYEVRVNADTGSLLFVFAKDEQSEEKMDQLAAFLRERIFASISPHGGKKEDSCGQEGHAGILTKSIQGTMRAFSSWIKKHTDGWFDISSAISLLFMLSGMKKMILTRQMPSGAQMLWWAVSLMRGWKTV